MATTLITECSACQVDQDVHGLDGCSEALDGCSEASWVKVRVCKSCYELPQECEC